MEVMEVYAILGEDYNEVLERIGKEAWIAKYLKKFADDSCREGLNKAVEDKDWEEAFKCAHSIKGLALNLGLGTLLKISSELSDVFRNGEPSSDPTELMEALNNEYERIIAIVSELP